MFGIGIKSIQVMREMEADRLAHARRRDWSRLPMQDIDATVSAESGTALPIFILGFHNIDDTTPRWVV